MTPPKGQTNNPHGRPPIDNPRVPLTARVKPETKAKLERESASRGDVGLGVVIDALAKRLRA